VKAIVQERYGPPDLLHVDEVDTPVAGDNEVLVRVHAASVHPDVWHMVRGLPYVLRLMGAGLRRPRNPIPGTDVAGRVEAVGRDVARFRPGDEVFGESIRGNSWANGGAYAEYVTVPEEALAHKPGNVTFAQAASVPTAGLIAWNNLRQGRLGDGRRVLVNGAAGGVGSIAVQLAKAHGAHVTGVDTTAKLELIRSLGADRVIDYTREDFTRGTERYDLILDIPGNHPFAACRRALATDGTYVLVGHDHFGGAGRRVLGSLPRFIRLMAMAPFVHQLPRASFSLPPKRDALALLRRLLESGQLTPVIDRTYPLAEVPEAIRYLQSGRARGRVVITLA
jgi:NADPH:quinone reductase-like Zn-dependent oxidoreductase